MAPVERCRHTLDFLAAVRNTSVTERVSGALDDLEAAYPDRAGRAAALYVLLVVKICRLVPSASDPSQSFSFPEAEPVSGRRKKPCYSTDESCRRRCAKSRSPCKMSLRGRNRGRCGEHKVTLGSRAYRFYAA
jgi:hypothetical protein